MARLAMTLALVGLIGLGGASVAEAHGKHRHQRQFRAQQNRIERVHRQYHRQQHRNIQRYHRQWNRVNRNYYYSPYYYGPGVNVYRHGDHSHGRVNFGGLNIRW